MNYNTSRPHLIIPEYGRHIQKMIDHAVGIEDDEERQKVAVAVINVKAHSAKIFFIMKFIYSTVVSGMLKICF